jgi:LL-diaminopimelate aminotransferase
MTFTPARRIRELPPYLFAQIDALKAAELARGTDVIDLGIGDPDRPTPPRIVAALAAAAADPATHRYPSYIGLADLRAAAAAFYGRRFGVSLDPAREVIALIGSKEGIAHLPFAVVDPGDVVLVPDPGYPVYATLTRFAGGEVYPMPLRRERGFLPDLTAIPADVARRAKLMWLNYPNNPTAALATAAFYDEAVAFARAHDLVIGSDLSYSEIYLEGPPPQSLLETPGARACTIEFCSLSKSYNMTGWRVGFAAGDPALVAGLAKVKTNVDSGVFDAVQRAAIAALAGDAGDGDELRRMYRARRDLFCDALAAAGFDVLRPRATFYVLVATPGGLPAIDFTARLLTEAGVVATPATGFGPAGEGYVRFSLTAPTARLAEAAARLARVRL